MYDEFAMLCFILYYIFHCYQSTFSINVVVNTNEITRSLHLHDVWKVQQIHEHTTM